MGKRSNFTESSLILYFVLFSPRLRVVSAAWLSLSLLLMDLVVMVTERVEFSPVTVSAPQSSSSL